MALEPAKLSDFQIAGSTLGTGTTARVYEGVHLVTGRPVAIKVMVQAASGGEMRERFAREALLLAEVESRHVGKILGFGFDKGQPFLVLERLNGETLDAKLRRYGPVPPLLAVRWIEQLIVGVRDCHDANIIHRDVKPSNVFLHRDGFDEIVKIIDFGVARLREISGEPGGLTSTNHLIGSMGYMAPEQFRNAKSVGFQADLYAVGVVIYRTLSGRLPFVSRNLEAVIRMKSERAPPPISSLAGMPRNPMLDWFIQKAMMREPEARFRSARDMLEHWWNVTASLDEDGTTDIMRGIGRVDESYAGPLHRPASAPGDTGEERHPASEEDLTIRRPPNAAPSGYSAVHPTTRTSRPPGAEPGWQYASDLTVREEAPRTQPVASPDTIHEGSDPPMTDRGPEADEDADPHDTDPFDLPTRSDPNLRKLVERELELQKARKGER